MLLMKPSPSTKKHESICPAPIAVIDVGTNTIRLLVGCIREGKIFRIAANRLVTRLGKDLQKTNRLSPDSIEKSITSILKLKEVCKKYGVQKIIALGTSALREAENREEFLSDVKKTAAIDIEVISGEKEAELTLKGILTSLHYSIASFPNLLLVDIGGGSTEWILCDFGLKNKKIPKSPIINHQSSICNLNMGSIPIGAVKLFETFIKHDPPAPEELIQAKNLISQQFFMALNSSLINCHSSLSLIVTGGTATTIAAIDMSMDEYDGDKIHLHKISLPTLKTIYKRLITLPHNDRSKIKGLETERADIIISGTLILLTLMERLNIKEVIVSDYGLLEGTLISYNYNHEKGIRKTE
jgi:exopolyphosphatase/guanosine-5'-triphosphate,3'-diphosphate pyrophosphatase